MISTQHAGPLRAVRSEPAAECSGSEETAPSMEDMSKLIEEKVNDHEDRRNSSSRMVSQL